MIRNTFMGGGKAAGLVRLVGAVGLAAGTILGGCGSSDKVNDGLGKENLELRSRNAQLEQDLKDRQAKLSELAATNDTLQAQLNESKNAPAVSEPIGSSRSGGTGFEGIDGVGSSTNSRGEIVVDVAGDVLFDPGSVVLKSSARKTLDRVASVIESRYSSNSIRVAGHTDSDPLKKTADKYKDNEELSAQRALAVERYLASKGVDRNRMYAAAYGPSQSKGSKKASRRVEIVILQGGD